MQICAAAAPVAERTMMTRPLSICWFRQDLRLADNPALSAAAAQGDVLPVFILDDDAAGADGLARRAAGGFIIR